MKYLLIILFISFQYLSFGQNDESEIIIQSSSDTISIFDIYSIGESTPISNDSINHIDESNLKQGIWVESSSYVGNCTNSTSSSYEYYRDNKLLMSYIITYDRNACYPNQRVFYCKKYDDKGSVLFEMNNTLPIRSKDDYLWSSIKNYDKKVIHPFHGYTFAKAFFEENTKRKKKRKPKLTYNKKVIPGVYSKYKDGNPSEKYFTRK